MASFAFLQTYGGVDTDISGSGRNVTGAPVAIYEGDLAVAYGEIPVSIAGVYRFTVEGPASISCRRVAAADIGNPLIFAGMRTVYIGTDWEYYNQNLLPGWDVGLRPDMQIGDEFEIGVGCIWDSTTSRWHRVLSFGPAVAGFVQTARTIKIQNATAGALTSCKLVATNAIRVENDPTLESTLDGLPMRGLRPFLWFRQTGILNPESDADLSGAAITFANAAAGVCDLLVDGVALDIYDVTNGVFFPGGVGLSCDDGTTVYRFADGTKYQGGEFALSSELTDTDTANIYVSDGGDSVWLSADSTTFVPGSQGIDITEDGQTAGTITASGLVEVHLRLEPPSGATVDLNARSFSLRAVGIDGSSAELSYEQQGSFQIAQGDAPLNVRVNAISASYGRPRYDEDGTPNESGDYVEDLSNPGTYVLATEAADGGNYGSLLDYLSDIGVTIEGI